MGEAAGSFAVLSLIVAPAVLTNASAVLTMSTSNRLARVTDRARELARLLEAGRSDDSPRFLHELGQNETRALLILRALRSFYLAMGGFAAATMLSLIGAVAAALEPSAVSRTLEIVAMVAGVVGVGGLVYGSSMLLRETHIAVTTLRERAANVRARVRQ